MRFSLKNLTACLLGAICLAGTASADEAGILYWMVDNPTIVRNGKEVASLDKYKSPEGYVAEAARVVATTAGGETVFLKLYGDTTGGGDFALTECTEAELAGGYRTGPVVASLSGLNAKSYTYAIELGTVVKGSWVTLAVSDPRTFDKIAEFSNLKGLDLPAAIWNPTTYNVPEPTGGLLTLLGLAVLALRRKEMRK